MRLMIDPTHTDCNTLGLAADNASKITYQLIMYSKLRRLFLLSLVALMLIFPLHARAAPIELDQHIGLTQLEIKATESNLEVNLPKVYILPSSPLYDLKRLWEKVRLFLSKSPQQREEFLLELSQLRLAETLELLQTNQHSLAQATLQDYQRKFNQALNLRRQNKAQSARPKHLNAKATTVIKKDRLISYLVGEYELEWQR